LPNAETQYGEKQADGSQQSELQPGTIERLNPGETFTFAAPNRPNSQLDPFMRLMLREVASGAGASYESLSRDYSQSNYSSSRLSLLDDRDLWRMLQKWFIRSFRMKVHRAWLQAAVLSRAVSTISVEAYALDPESFAAVRFKPRGWNWVDPTKEVQAAKDAVRCGFTTVGRVIELTGNGDDLEDILEDRAAELELMQEYGLTFDTDPAAAPGASQNASQGASENANPPINMTDSTDMQDGADAMVAAAERFLRTTNKGVIR